MQIPFMICLTKQSFEGAFFVSCMEDSITNNSVLTFHLASFLSFFLIPVILLPRVHCQSQFKLSQTMSAIQHHQVS